MIRDSGTGLLLVGVMSFFNEEVEKRHVACGYRSSFAVMEDGRMFSWGDGQSGQLGHADLTEGCVQVGCCADVHC